MNHFEKVKSFLLDLEFDIKHEDEGEELVIVDKEEEGIVNLLVDCEDPILIIELPIMEVKGNSSGHFEKLLKMNREVVHGAFCLDEEGKRLIFRDTLQLENLDHNELEGSLNAISLMLGQYYNDLIEMSKN